MRSNGVQASNIANFNVKAQSRFACALLCKGDRVGVDVIGKDGGDLGLTSGSVLELFANARNFGAGSLIVRSPWSSCHLCRLGFWYDRNQECWHPITARECLRARRGPRLASEVRRGPGRLYCGMIVNEMLITCPRLFTVKVPRRRSASVGRTVVGPPIRSLFEVGSSS